MSMSDTTPAVLVACVECGEAIRERDLKSGKVWCRVTGSVHTICERSPDYHHHPDLGPESGHTFRVSVASRGSYAVVGVEGHTDAEDFQPFAREVEVRAWDLPEALRRVAQRPLSVWFDPEEDREDTRLEEPHYGR